MKRAYELATEKNIKAHVGNVLTGEVYYDASDSLSAWSKMGVLAVGNGSGGTLYECGGGGRQEGAVYMYRYKQPSDRNGGHYTRRT